MIPGPVVNMLKCPDAVLPVYVCVHKRGNIKQTNSKYKASLQEIIIVSIMYENLDERMHTVTRVVCTLQFIHKNITQS